MKQQEHLLFRKTFLIGCLFLISLMGWGQNTAIYSVSTTNSVVASGISPSGSSSTYAQTYSTAKQMTSGNSASLTLSGYAGYKITNVVLEMRSNSSSGAGTLNIVAGSTSISTVNPSASFNSISWNGSWSSTYVNVTKVPTLYSILNGENVVITISATANSLYIQKFSITYEPASSSITYSGNGNDSGSAPTDASSPYNSGSTVTVLGNTGSLAKTGYSFNGWNTAANGSGTSYIAGDTFAISSNTILYAQWLPTSPTISTSGSLSALTTTYGTASSTSTFSVSGTALTADILVTPPAGFEVSTNASSGFGSSVTLTQTGGSVSSTPIYIRLAAATNAGAYSGNVVLSSTGATDVNVATVSSTVNTKALTISGLTATPKEYDTTTSVVISGTPSYTGLVNSESFSVTGAVSYAFASVNAATPQSITRTGSYNAPSTNYTVTQPTLTANITKKALTIASAAANSKNYDGTNSATLTGTLNGVISPDAITLTLSGTFNDATVGTSKSVTSTSTISSTTNYTLTQPTGLTANIVAVVPNAPVIGTITGTSGQLSVAFTSPTNNGGTAITNYAYSIDNGVTFTTLSPTQTTSPIVITGLTNGTAYPVVIYAINSVGNGAPSSAVSGTPSIVPTTLATWNFTANVSPTNVPTNITISDLVQGNNNGTTTILSSASSSDYSGASGTNNAGAAAKAGALVTGASGSAYFEFTITPAAAYYFTLSSISFGARSTGTGPQAYTLRSNLDNYASDIATGSFSNNSTWSLKTNASINSSSTIGTPNTYRIYGYNGTGSPAVNTANWRIDDLNLLGFVNGPSNNWIGGTSTWNATANWSLSRVPLSTDDVTISSGSPVMDVDFALGTGKTLTISGTGTLTINSGRTLSIAGTADFGGKLVTFKSDETGSGRLGQVAGTLMGASNVKVERYIAQGKRAFRFLAPGVTTTNFIKNNWQQATHITGSTTGANGFDLTASGNPSMYTYNNQVGSGTGWTTIANTDATNLEAEKGYRLLVRGDRTPSLITATTADNMNTAITLSATGTLKTGTVTIDATSTPTAINNTNNTTTNGFSLVANPYVSPIDWDLVTKTGITDTYYIWDTNVGTAAQRGRYVSYNSSTGINNYGNTGVSTANDIIQAGQAFFVKNTLDVTARTITFNESNKSYTSSFVLRTTNQNTLLSVLLYAPTELAIGGFPMDGITTVFGADFDNQVGYGDVPKLESAGENLAWFSQSKKLDINAQAPIVASDVLAIKSLRLGANKSYTFRIKATNFDTSLTGYLVDNYLNTQQVIDFTQDYFANFSTTTEALSFGEDRFKIVFSTALNNNQFAKDMFVVYPNPVVNNNFTIKLPATLSGNVKVTLHNLLGQEVFQVNTIASPILEIAPKNTLSSGVYIVSVMGEGISSQQKITIQ
jgi:hypothetical protein